MQNRDKRISDRLKELLEYGKEIQKDLEEYKEGDDDIDFFEVFNINDFSEFIDEEILSIINEEREEAFERAKVRNALIKLNKNQIYTLEDEVKELKKDKDEELTE